MIKDAYIDDSGEYRYFLSREWGGNKNNFVNFIMLNPSTADDKSDDPTIRSCIRLAKSNGYDGFYVTNLFALRATDPRELENNDNRIGKDNDIYIKKYARKCKKIVFAWGNYGSLYNRDKQVLELLNKICKPWCLAINITGQPKHPLFVNRDTKFIPYIKNN